MATLLAAVRSMNQKATQRFGASPLGLLLAAYSGMFVGGMIGNWLFPDFLGRQIARRNAEKQEQYEMDRKASVEDTIKGHCGMREYYNHRIERLRSRIAALEEQDIATRISLTAYDCGVVPRLVPWKTRKAPGTLEALDRPEVGHQCLEIML